MLDWVWYSNSTFDLNVGLIWYVEYSTYQFECWIQFECRIFEHSNSMSHLVWIRIFEYQTLNPTFKSNVEYRMSNSIQHSNRMSNIEYQTRIQHSNRMSNIEYQTQSTFKFWMSNIELKLFDIQIECRILDIKLISNIQIDFEYRISNSIQHSNWMSNIEYQTQSNIQIECWISNIKLNPTFKFECQISNIKLIFDIRIWMLNIKLESNIQIWMSN